MCMSYQFSISGNLLWINANTAAVDQLYFYRCVYINQTNKMT